MMKSILLLGAGRSSSALIQYVLDFGARSGCRVVLGDYSLDAARQRIGSSDGEAIRFDIMDKSSSAKTIAEADIVVSLLPAHLHIQVAHICLELKKHLITASYVSDEMKALHEEALSKNLLFLNECGLDPGIDHMSAMQVMDRIRDNGGEITSFESFTGGLIASETDPGNPWRYKFTWNSRNVVMAGQGTAKFLLDGRFKYVPYQQLFNRITPVTVPGYGEYEGYANRDSLKYLEAYGLHNVKTMIRGTLRNKGFCDAWNILVQLGCCDDTYQMEGVSKMTHAGFMSAFITGDHNAVVSYIVSRFGVNEQGEELKRLRWSGLFSDELVGMDKGTPAQILEHILNKKWKLNPDDKDMIVMWHRFVYNKNGKSQTLEASLIAKGADSVDTAMARTVGWPLAIAARLLFEGKVSQRGVVIPTSKEFYEPILDELKTLGIELTERHV